MKKPVEAIERMRDFVSLVDCADRYPLRELGWNASAQEDANAIRAILAYLDSFKEWPAEWTKEAVIGCADFLDENHYGARASRCLRALAELAPVRKKRMVEIWKDPETKKLSVWENEPLPLGWIGLGWRKVGQCEIED